MMMIQQTMPNGWGQKFHVSVGPEAQCQWVKQRGGKAASKVSMNDQVLRFLVEYCLPCTALNHHDCFTQYENKTSGEQYCAHPMFIVGDCMVQLCNGVLADS